ncbi:MAG: DEAD/DEAH box helicase [Parcubacteria group bacterium]
MYNKRFGGPRRTVPRRQAPRSRFSTGENIPHSKFINKTVITEEVVVFVPEHKIENLPVEDIIKKNIIEKGYKELTPIQDKTIPYLLQGLDVVGIANTGTGKTAAFLIPLIDKVLKNKNVNVLVVVPTRELAQQIEAELIDFARGTGLYSVCCVGGAPIGKQIRDLKHRNQFVIGTPGRLKDLIETKHIHLSQFNTIVLDEADRMLDMGFVHDMRFMMDLMPKERHTLFFSATISREIESLIKDFLNNPVRISVKTQDTAKNVHQDIVKVLPGRTKLDLLVDLLKQPDFSKVLIFGRTKHGVEKLSNELIRRGFKSESIHGNKNQGQRQRALDTFKRDNAQILVATDVAARGLDISGVTHVINFDVPATFDDYVHRIGRTGRGDKKGKALTFVE